MVSIDDEMPTKKILSLSSNSFRNYVYFANISRGSLLSLF